MREISVLQIADENWQDRPWTSEYHHASIRSST